jgi:preprotein translocase subunit Sec63
MKVRQGQQAQQEPWEILGITPQASAQEMRQAYLEKIRQYPPDRAPAEFERIRDAYEQMRTPGTRLTALLEKDKDVESLMDFLREIECVRTFAGPEPWLAVIREK